MLTLYVMYCPQDYTLVTSFQLLQPEVDTAFQPLKDEEMEAQRGLETCLKAHSYKEVEPGFNLRHSSSRVFAFYHHSGSSYEQSLQMASLEACKNKD